MFSVIYKKNNQNKHKNSKGNYHKNEHEWPLNRNLFRSRQISFWQEFLIATYNFYYLFL